MQSFQICELLWPHAEMSAKKTVELPATNLGSLCGRYDGSATGQDYAASGGGAIILDFHISVRGWGICPRSCFKLDLTA